MTDELMSNDQLDAIRQRVDNEQYVRWKDPAFADRELLLAEVERLRAENERLEAERQQERNYSAGLLAMQDELYHAAVDLRWKYDDLGCALDNAWEGDDTMDKAISDVITALDRTETLDEEDIAEAHMLEVSRLKKMLAEVLGVAEASSLENSPVSKLWVRRMMERAAELGVEVNDAE